MHRGVILGLQWADVDFDQRQLEVAQQLPVERGRPVLKQLKTERSARIVTSGRATAKDVSRVLRCDNERRVNDYYKPEEVQP